MKKRQNSLRLSAKYYHLTAGAQG